MPSDPGVLPELPDNQVGLSFFEDQKFKPSGFFLNIDKIEKRQQIKTEENIVFNLVFKIDKEAFNKNKAFYVCFGAIKEKIAESFNNDYIQLLLKSYFFSEDYSVIHEREYYYRRSIKSTKDKKPNDGFDIVTYKKMPKTKKITLPQKGEMKDDLPKKRGSVYLKIDPSKFGKESRTLYVKMGSSIDDNRVPFYVHIHLEVN